MFVGLRDDTNEQRENTVDEESYEHIQPYLVEHINQCAHFPHLRKCLEHVVSVDEGVHGLHSGDESPELVMEGTEYSPACQGESEIDKETTEQEAQHIWHRVFQR